MNIHEYQAKALLEKFGVAVPKGAAAQKPGDFESAIAQLDTKAGIMVKSQIHAGGRGKGVFKDGFKGGVKFSPTREKALENARAMLGNTLVTAQTGPEGRKVQTIYFTEAANLGKRPDGRDDEYYLAILLDRATSRPVIVASSEGGVEIEKVAHDSPERIFKVHVDPAAGLQPYQCRRMAFALGFTGAQVGEFQKIAMALYDLVMQKDAGLVEVNPLIVTKDGKLVALDAKINIDANAVFRQPALAKMRDTSQEDPMELKASEHDLNYVSLDGDIACMVNGAGLAMATMDLIKLHGGSPANFLDVGGGATAERVTAAFNLILSNPKVKAILVNIFGGIVRCDLIAEGVITAVKNVGVKVPVVVRLEGTNAVQAREMLAASGLKVIAAADLTDAAQKAVAAAR